MARYVLVEVDNNATAERLCAQINNAGEAKGMRVIALFSKATQMCDCVVPVDHSVLGSKLGWRLCPQCRKPKSGHGQTLWNMLDDPGTPSKYKNLCLVVRWVWKDGLVKTVRSVAEKDWK